MIAYERHDSARCVAVGSESVDVIGWLLDSDPSVRWQAMRDLTGANADEVAAERARIATEGAGARLLALQASDGRWGGAFAEADAPFAQLKQLIWKA